MKRNLNDYAALLVCALPLAAGLILRSRFPEQMIIHWDAKGAPNGYAPRDVAIFVLPGMLLLLQWFMPALLKADPKYENMSKSLIAIVKWVIPAVSILCSGSTLAAGLGMEVSIEILAPLFVGIVFIIVGNYLPKTKQSYTMGIKLPWTLNSEENWNRTHRLAGFLWVAAGICFVIMSVIKASIGFILPLIAIMVIVPAVYSYVLYRKGI